MRIRVTLTISPRRSYRNIQRLFTKVSSGGKDDGYSTVGKKASGGQKASGGVDAGKVGNAAKRLFLGK